MPPSGGAAVQVTRNSGVMAKESFDGKYVYFLKGNTPRTLWKAPVDGGDESQVAESISGRNYALSWQGIYWVSTALEHGEFPLHYLPFAGGKPKAVLNLPQSPQMGMSVSPDGRSLLFTRELKQEGQLGFWRWTSIFLGVAGTYRQNDSVDVVYEANGRRVVAAKLRLQPIDEA